MSPRSRTIIGIILTLVWPVNWFMKSILLAFMTGVISYELLRSESVKELKVIWKTIIVFVVFICLAPPISYIVYDQYIKDHASVVKAEPTKSPTAEEIAKKLAEMFPFLTSRKLNEQKALMPSIEVLDIYPICIGEPDRKPPYESIYGIAAIVHVRGKEGTAFISELDLIGRKFLSYRDDDAWCYTEYFGKKSISQQEIDEYFRVKKPYIFLSVRGWPLPSEFQIRATEEKYLKFVFLKPRPFFNGAKKPEKYICDYIGFADGTKKAIQFEYPDFFYLFKMNLTTIKDNEGHQVAIWQPYDICDEIRLGDIRFSLQFGQEPLIVTPDKIRTYKRIKISDWENSTGSQLILEKPYF